jgi:hypothetical protein
MAAMRRARGGNFVPGDGPGRALAAGPAGGGGDFVRARARGGGLAPRVTKQGAGGIRENDGRDHGGGDIKYGGARAGRAQRTKVMGRPQHGQAGAGGGGRSGGVAAAARSRARMRSYCRRAAALK